MANQTGMPLSECDDVEKFVEDLSSEITQDKWMYIIDILNIDNNKMRLVIAANSCDFHKQKCLGLLCWVEERGKSATFEKLCHALHAVGLIKLSKEVRSYRRILYGRMIQNMRHRRPQRQLVYRSPPSPKSQQNLYQFENYTSPVHPVWKLSDPLVTPFSSPLTSPSSIFYPSRSLPSINYFDLTSTVSVHGERVRLIKREANTAHTQRKGKSPKNAQTRGNEKHTKTFSGEVKKTGKNCVYLYDLEDLSARLPVFDYFNLSRLNAALSQCFGHSNLLAPIIGKVIKQVQFAAAYGQIEIVTSILTTVPLTSAIFSHCHPDEIQSVIEKRFFDYIFGTSNEGSCSFVAGSLVLSLEAIDGLVVRLLRRGSIRICVELHKSFAAKTLWMLYQTGKLATLIESSLITETALKMSGALTITLETSIDEKEMGICLSKFENKSPFMRIRDRDKLNHLGRSITGFKSSLRSSRMHGANNTYTAPEQQPQKVVQQIRTSSVPSSRSIALELAPSICTVKPTARKTGKNLKSVANQKQNVEVIEALNTDNLHVGEDDPSHQPPPPTPESCDRGLSSLIVDDETRTALEEFNVKIQNIEECFIQFDSKIRRFIDHLKSSKASGVHSINSVADLRKYATILRQKDEADTALIIEEYINLTETMEQIHREAATKLWLRVQNLPVANESEGDRFTSRTGMRLKTTEILEKWQKMLDPEYKFRKIEQDNLVRISPTLEEDEIDIYGGLLTHVPVMLDSAKSSYKIFLEYISAK